MSVDLFTPLTLGPLTLPNRVFMAPLTRMRATMPGNVPGELNALYYRQRATAGLIITEATPVSPYGHGYYKTPGIHTEAQAEGWQLVTRAVHEAGGRIFCQLWHVGRQSHPDLQPGGVLPVAPSALASGGESPVPSGIMKPRVVPRALETDEVPGIVEEFRRGATLAKAAGFDGVEVHGANGYLLEQFLLAGSNQRTDRYGGSVEKRARFYLEVVAAVTAVWGRDRVGARLSPANTYGGVDDPDRWGVFSYLVGELARFQLAYLHFVEPRVAGHTERTDYDQRLLSRNFRPFLTGDTRLVSAGGHDYTSAARAIGDGEADAVAFGRLFISNPDLVQRFQGRNPLNRYDRATFYGGTEVGYTDYPALNNSVT